MYDTFRSSYAVSKTFFLGKSVSVKVWFQGLVERWLWKDMHLWKAEACPYCIFMMCVQSFFARSISRSSQFHHWPICLVRLFVHAVVRLLDRAFVRSFNRLMVGSLAHSIAHSIARSCLIFLGRWSARSRVQILANYESNPHHGDVHLNIFSPSFLAVGL